MLGVEALHSGVEGILRHKRVDAHVHRLEAVPQVDLQIGDCGADVFVHGLPQEVCWIAAIALSMSWRLQNRALPHARAHEFARSWPFGSSARCGMTLPVRVLSSA